MIDLPSNSVCSSNVKLIWKLFTLKITCQFFSSEQTGATELPVYEMKGVHSRIYSVGYHLGISMDKSFMEQSLPKVLQNI